MSTLNNFVTFAAIDSSRKRQAWITLATNDTYCVGALVMGYSLRQHTTRELVALITDEVTPHMKRLMQEVFDVLKNIDIIKGR